MRGHSGPHFLLGDSVSWLEHTLKAHPVSGGLILVALLVAVVAVLKRQFGRITIDIVIFAVIVYAIILLLTGSFFTLVPIKGFRAG